MVTGVTGSAHGVALAQAPLSAIAERSNSGEDTEDEDDEEEGGWKSAASRVGTHDSVDESVIKAGYLWKKGERRKVGDVRVLHCAFPHCFCRHGRNGGSSYDRHNWLTTRRMQSTNYFAFWNYRMSIPVHKSR